MELKTLVELPENLPNISHNDELLLMGSCFAESIGKLLVENKFHCDVNPFGILYNPLSVSTALRQIMEGKNYTDTDLLFSQENYHSFMHHGSFSALCAEESLSLINSRLQAAHRGITQLKFLIITLGTSWVYTLKSDGSVVSNCHKLADREFVRRQLSVEEIVSDYTRLIKEFTGLNPQCNLIFTISPIRHIKDGMHGNQLSKAVLLLAVDKLKTIFPERIFYFPSYEIMLDELRDYRFYADDMLHPSPLAIKYIWERFTDAFFSGKTQSILKEYENIRKALNHKPFHTGSEEYKCFLEQIVLKIKRLKEKYPNLDVQKELDLCLTQLK